MPLTKQDWDNCFEELPHPREWLSASKEVLHECEDGITRRFSFFFKVNGVSDAGTQVYAEPEVEADGPQGDDGE